MPNPMKVAQPRRLSETAIKAAACPPDRNWVPLRDPDQPGLYVRVYSSGAKAFWFVYRPVGGGRSVNKRWVRIGTSPDVSLKAARDAARVMAGRVAAGIDVASERREEKRRERALLEPAINLYKASLEERHVVKAKEVVSLLHRELLGPLGNVDIAALDRQSLVKRIDAVKKSGRPGTAKELRTRSGVFLGWCVDRGLIQANPLAGWRQPRATRAERLAPPGRALADHELGGFWRAATVQEWPFGQYLQLLLLLGQRRTDTVLMRWSDLFLDTGPGIGLWPDLPRQKNVWIVPAETTKSGRPHYIPLPSQAVEILRQLPRRNKSDLVFPGRKAKPMTGWSKRLPDVYAATAKEGLARWTLHDLRRTMRTGLGRLGVDRVIAELLLDHAISDDLAKIYDRGSYWPHRVEAAQRWADHVFEHVSNVPAEVVPFDGHESAIQSS